MKRKISGIEKAFLKFQFGLKTRIDLYKKISSFIANGVPIHNIVTELKDEYLKNKSGDPRGLILGQIDIAMSRGESFGTALSKWCPASEAMIILGGEKSGNIEQSFHNAIQITESAKRMKSTIIGEISYPIILLTMLCLLIYAFSTQAIPELTTVMTVEKWPDVSKKLHSMSMFVKDDWWKVVLGVISFIAFAIITMPSTIGTKRKYLNKIPPWSIYKTFQSSVFLISTSAMMGTGTPIFDAIEKLKQMSPKYVSWELGKILNAIENGAKNGEAFNVGGFLETDTGIDVSIYGKVASLDTALETIGSNSIENAIIKIKATAGMLKNLVLFGVASYIGWVYYAFYTLTSSIGAQSGF